jgi:hypothetical protein
MFQPYPDGISTRRTSAMVSVSHGRAILTTMGRLTESLWKESGAVVLTSVGDSAAIGEKSQQILTDAAERRRLGNAARSLYLNSFHHSHIVSALSGD